MEPTEPTEPTEPAEPTKPTESTDGSFEAGALAAVCERLGLGVPIGAPLSITGRELHRAWRVETGAGRFFVEQLNRALLASPGATARGRAAERFAARLHARGVPAVAAIAHDGDPLVEVGGAWWLAYPWVEGEVRAPHSASARDARAIGETLAAIHRAGIEDRELYQVRPARVHDSEWTALTREGETAGAPWAVALAGARGDLRAAATRGDAASGALRSPPIASHRDLGPWSVIWSRSEAPAIVGWESAGAIHPGVEVVRAALDWSVAAGGDRDRERFSAVLLGYRDAGGVVDERVDARVDAAIESTLSWLAYQMRRAARGEREGKKARERWRAVALAELEASRATIRGRDRWIEWTRAVLA